MTQLSVALSGDCMVMRGALITSDAKAAAVRDLLHAADFAFTNLEVVPNDAHGYPVLDAWGGGLVTNSAVLGEISTAGFNVLGCANNHALDMGIDGLLATMHLLRERRMPFAGVGRDLTAARMPVYVDQPAGSLALVSCSATFNRGQEAGDPSPQIQGRPGLNPLRHTMTLSVTTEQAAVLRAIHAETGLAARHAENLTLLGLDPDHLSEDQFSLFGVRFCVADAPGVATACDEGDLEQISRWVQEARQRADLVAVSVHSHEHGATPGLPAEFLRDFAHRVIDAGADMVAAHGPHFLRGLELYREKPIFYSLGNIVNQMELADAIAADDYARVGAPSDMTPAQYFALRSDHDRIWFAPRRKYWQTVLPVLTFDGRQLVRAQLYPVDLGFGQPVRHRGRPRLADPAEGTAILGALTELSKSFGTQIATIQTGSGPVGQAVLRADAA